MKKMFRGLILLAIVLVLQLTLLPPNEAYANEKGLSITELNIQVMPEFINPDNWDYNVPSLLVGYHGSVTNETDQPYDGDIIVRIPTNSPQFTLGYIAQEVTEDQHLPLDFTINEDEQYVALTPTEPIAPNETLNFILEYFNASIDGEVERKFTYEFLANGDIENFNIAFYAPFQGRDFQLDPEPTFTTNSFGVEIYVFEYSAVDEEEVFNFEVSYLKDSIVTTVEAFNDFEMPNDDVHAGFNEQGTTGSNKSSIISTEDAFLIGLTIIILGAFVFIILRKKKNGNTTSKETSVTPKKIVNKEEEIKKLRKMLADGKIDEKTYKEKRTKLG